jgi:tRNA A-37 threonylcarbamoyl transferase component Bud32
LAVDAGPDVCAEDFEGYETDAGPMTLMAKRVISSVPTKLVYESEQNGDRVLVKCWPQLKFDPKYLARNLRLLAFLQKARSLRQSGFNAAPEVLDFGLNTFGLMLVTRWTEGQTLTEWLSASPDGRQRALVAHALLNAVRRLHVLGLSHGDVKADNVVVPQTLEDELPRVVLVDIPDLSADGDDGITVGMVPQALESALSCPSFFVFQGPMVSIETGRTRSEEDTEAGVHSRVQGAGRQARPSGGHRGRCQGTGAGRADAAQLGEGDRSR